MDQNALTELVDRLRREEDVPGLVAAVSRAGERVLAASGTANLRSGLPMTTDVQFLFGSVTKVWVTTLLMQLVEEGRLALDQPVTDVLPDFRTADKTASDQLTMWHLVTHTSGIDGADYCPDDLGRGPECVARFVESLAGLGHLHEPGRYWSYCNPGFVVAGRVIEVVTGQDFDDAFRERLVGRLGLSRTFLTAEESILHPVTIGHFRLPEGGHRPTGRYLLPHSLGPAGTSLCTTVSDALDFADVHLGRRDGVLSADGLKQMADRQVDLPAPGLGSFGLGWGRNDRYGVLQLSHGGGSLGGLAQLVVVPDRDLALVAFVNSASGAGLVTRLVDEVLTAEGLERAPVPSEEPGPLEQFAGRFARHGFDIDIRVEGDELVVLSTPDPDNAVLKAYEATAPEQMRCKAVGPHAFGVPAVTSGALATAVGVLIDGDYLYLGGRLARRVGSPTGSAR